MCRHLPAVFSLVTAIGIGGCNSPSAPTPTRAVETAVVPPVAVPPPVPPTYTLSGVVSELAASGTVPAADVPL